MTRGPGDLGLINLPFLVEQGLSQPKIFAHRVTFEQAE